MRINPKHVNAAIDFGHNFGTIWYDTDEVERLGYRPGFNMDDKSMVFFRHVGCHGMNFFRLRPGEIKLVFQKIKELKKRYPTEIEQYRFADKYWDFDQNDREDYEPLTARNNRLESEDRILFLAMSLYHQFCQF